MAAAAKVDGDCAWSRATRPEACLGGMNCENGRAALLVRPSKARQGAKMKTAWN
jgi:hypothetical protein